VRQGSVLRAGFSSATCAGGFTIKLERPPARMKIRTYYAHYRTPDSYDLAEKILRVLTDDKMAKKLSYKAYKRIKKELTLTNTARKYIELYSSLEA
jgi:glycosyltransferase involved in cell wall biosynthesis